MFTGLIQGIGSLVKIQSKGADSLLGISFGSLDHQNIALGDSIAVNGVCLTVTTLTESGFEADVSAETLRLTTLGTLTPNTLLNLEKSLTPNSFLGGHLVSGHVDGIGEVLKRRDEGRSQYFRIVVDKSLAPYIAKKGSICVDGISLTVNQVYDDGFEVNIVPHTLAHTNLDEAQVGRKVNIEVDLVARYLERLMLFQSHDNTGITQELLQNSGFTIKS